MLYVVALPLLAEADDSALRRLRAQYHPGEAELIGPHFTLVFGADDAEAPRLAAALDALETRPFWFMLDRLARHDSPPPRRAAYLFALPDDGDAELRDLHDRLNPAMDPVPFEPHLTLGLFDSATEAERVARIVQRQHLPMRGRIEELALVRRTAAGLETLKSRLL
jgi:2'-5' RNA ligase